MVGAGRFLRPDAPGALPQRHLGDGPLHGVLLGGVRAARGLALPAAAAPDTGGGVLRTAAGDDVLSGAEPVHHSVTRSNAKACAADAVGDPLPQVAYGCALAP